jgi:hypothetical protein
VVLAALAYDPFPECRMHVQLRNIGCEQRITIGSRTWREGNPRRPLHAGLILSKVP